MFRRGIATAIIVFLLGILSATPALALPTINTHNTVNTTPDYDHEIVTPDTEAGQLLPINRWAPAITNIHTRRGFDPGTMLLAGQETIGSMFMSFGGACYSWAATLVGLASITDVTQAGSAELDRIAASIGKALTGDTGKSSIAAAVMALILASSAWTARREGPMAIVKQIIPRILVLSLISIMIAGAMASSGGGKTHKPYMPGKMSPAWITKQVTDTLHKISDMTLTEPMRYMSEAKQNKNKDWAHCDAIVAGLHKEYMAKTSRNKPGAVIPLAMSMIWEESGPKAWSAIQFGADKDTLAYAEKSWCHLAEARTGKAPAEHRKIAKLAGMSVPGSADSLAFSNLSNNDIDQATIGWAACAGRGNGVWTPTDKNAMFFDNDRKTGGGLSKACEQWWKPGWKVSSDGADKVVKEGAAKIPGLGSLMDLLNVDSDSRFDWWQDPGTIRKTIPNTGVSEYIINLHGLSNSALSVTVGVTYAMSSLLVLAVFAALAFGVIASKMVLFIMSLAIFALLVATLFPNVNTAEKLKQVCKGWVSFALIASIALAVMSVLIVITKAVIALGENMLADYPLGLILWTGASPALAVFALNVVFKKIFKLPSIFKPSGMLAWAGSAAGIGGTAFAGAAVAKRMGAQMVRKVAATRTAKETVGAFNTGAGRKDAGAGLTLGSKVEAKHDFGSGGVSPYRVSGGMTGVTAAGSVADKPGVTAAGSVADKPGVTAAGSVAASNSPVSAVSYNTSEKASKPAAGKPALDAASAPAVPLSPADTTRVPSAGDGAVSASPIERPGWLETQRMRMEMNPESHAAVFASDVKHLSGVLRAGVNTVKEQGVGDALRDVTPIRALSEARDRHQAYKTGVLEKPSGKERLTSGGRAAWAGVKATARVAGVGLDRVSRLPRVAGVGARGVLKGSAFLTGAVLKAAGVTVAGSMIPGVGLVAGPMMGVASLRKSFDRARSASAMFREQTAADYGNFKLGELGVSSAGKAPVVPGVRAATGDVVDESDSFGLSDKSDGVPLSHVGEADDVKQEWGVPASGVPVDTKDFADRSVSLMPPVSSVSAGAGVQAAVSSAGAGLGGKPQAVPPESKQAASTIGKTDASGVRQAQEDWLRHAQQPVGAPSAKTGLDKGGKPSVLDALADGLEESAGRSEAARQKRELEQDIKDAAAKGKENSETGGDVSRRLVPTAPQNPTGNTPMTPQNPTGNTPTAPQNPTGNPATSQNPTGNPATSQNPTGNPATSQNPTGNPATSQNPTGNPTTPQNPTGNPATSQNPTGNTPTTIAPIAASSDRQTIGQAAGISQETNTMINRTLAKSKTRKPPAQHTSKPQI